MKKNNVIFDENIVLILGSKPDAKTPLSDYTYCSNATASYYEKKLKNHKNITSIVSATEVILGTRKNSLEKDKWVEDRKKRIANSISNEIIMYWTDAYPDSMNLLKKTPCHIPTKSITSYEVAMLIKHIAGVSIPLFTFDHISNKDHAMLNLLKFIKGFVSSMIGGPHSISGLFRPSTGVISLIYAISQHGENAKYIVSGISINDRGNYPDGAKNTWSGEKSLKSNHVYVDKKILTILSKKYNIKTTEEGLSLIFKLS